jgi:mono/diheme cytochrome c family protein
MVAILLAAIPPAAAQVKPEVPNLKPVDLKGNPQAGEKIYLATCWTCHGLGGDGKGPAAAGMQPPPTDFSRTDALKKKSDGEIWDAILKGKPASAMYAQSLSPQDTVDVAAYLRTLARSAAQEKGFLEALARGDREAGRSLYNEKCWPCHGPTGRGNGPAASALRPPPADFTDPDLVAARTGSRLYQALTIGVPGTAMAPQKLSEKEKFDLIAYLRTLVKYSESRSASEDGQGDARTGKELYDKRCWSCHGTRGGGDGPAGIAMIPPATRFSDYEAMKDRTAQDWYAAIQSGVPGTAMYPQRLTEHEVWDLIAYLRSLGRRKPETP